MVNTLVLYHANCRDGWCAAWLMKQAFPAAELVPVQYGEDHPDVTGKAVFIVDFSYPRDVLLRMRDICKSITVLDHHKTAEAELADLDFCVFDMKKSGGRLTWEFLWDNELLSDSFNDTIPTPWLVEYTEDRDLWRWKLRYSKEINAALWSHPMDLPTWDALHRIDPLKTMVSEGAAILRYQQQVVDEHVTHATEQELAGYKVLGVNATTLFSDIAGKLAAGRPFGFAWFYNEHGQKVYSLRSRDNGMDVSEIAKQFGGGGHKHAAGFQTNPR